MQRQLIDMIRISPAQAVDYVEETNIQLSRQDEMQLIEGRYLQVFKRMTTRGQVKTFVEPLNQDR